MRGSAQLAMLAARRAAWQGDCLSPVHPLDQEGPGPSLDHPRQDSPVPTPKGRTGVLNPSAGLHAAPLTSGRSSGSLAPRDPSADRACPFPHLSLVAARVFT
jgi:hypothetical protein